MACHIDRWPQRCRGHDNADGAAGDIEVANQAREPGRGLPPGSEVESPARDTMKPD